jgi:hypothetical protein
VVGLLDKGAGWMVVGWWKYLGLGVRDVVLALGVADYVYSLGFGHICLGYSISQVLGSWRVLWWLYEVDGMVAVGMVFWSLNEVPISV